MIVFFNAEHVRHQGKVGVFRGELAPCFEEPTVFVMEGDYALDEIGVDVVNVLEGFEACRS